MARPRTTVYDVGNPRLNGINYWTKSDTNLIKEGAGVPLVYARPLYTVSFSIMNWYFWVGGNDFGVPINSLYKQEEGVEFFVLSADDGSYRLLRAVEQKEWKT